MILAWLIPLLLTSDGAVTSPILSLDEHSRLAQTPLDAWLYHDGPVPDLMLTTAATGEHNPDLIRADTLLSLLANVRDGGFNEAGGWVSVTLPHAVKGGIPVGTRDYKGWFATEFRVPPNLKDRTVGLYVGEICAAIRVFVNGQLIGEQGRDEPEDFWPGRRTVLGYHIPPALLHTDRPNTVAIFVHAAHVDTMLQDVFVGDARSFPQHAFWASQAARIPSILVTFLLLSMALYALAIYAVRRDRVDSLYFAFGTLGLTILLFGMWCQTWPFNGVYFLRLIGASIPLLTNYVLFFQRYYNIHYHGGRQRWASFALAVWFAISWALPARMVMAGYTYTVPVVMCSFFYCTYLTFRSYREGVAEARTALAGMALLTFCSFVQALRFFQGSQEEASSFSLGLLCFVGCIFHTLSRQREPVLTAAAHPMRRADDAKAADQQKVLTEVAVIAAEVEAVCRSVLTSVSEEQRGSIGQSSAVAETKAAMQSLLASGRNIMQAAQEVLHGAELTQRNNDQVSERLVELSRHSQRIAEILNVIREVANKSDLLALNAALEGVRAGHLGRGFTLVATQMQQLAETIMRAVSDIRELTVDIREASLSTESSNNEATRLATDTTKSARQISVFIAEQQSGTEQVSRAMEDIAEVAQVSAKNGDLILQRMQDLLRNADRLRAMVDDLNSSTDTPADAVS